MRNPVSPLVTFQCDLFSPGARFLTTPVPDYKYVLIVIDCYTRYVFHYMLKNKSAHLVQLKLAKLLDTVRGKQQKSFGANDGVNHIFLYADQGGEFRNSKLQTFLSSHNASITYLYDNKAALAERFIQTLQNKLTAAMELHDSGKAFNLWEAINDIIFAYNRSPHSSLSGNKTPIQVMSQLASSTFAFAKSSQYARDKAKIDRSIASMQHILPVGTPVKCVTTISSVQKMAGSERFTREIFFVSGYKRPIVPQEPVLIKLVDSKKVVLQGAFRLFELKRVSSKVSKPRINRIWEHVTDGVPGYIVSFEHLYPGNRNFVAKSNLSQYILLDAARASL